MVLLAVQLGMVLLAVQPLISVLQFWQGVLWAYACLISTPQVLLTSSLYPVLLQIVIYV